MTGEELTFEIDDKGSPAHHILAAVYAAGELPLGARSRVMEAIRKAMRWTGAIDAALVAHLSGLARHHDWSRRRLPRPGGLGAGRARPARRASARAAGRSSAGSGTWCATRTPTTAATATRPPIGSPS